ncbi:hypothetical protein [Georgenia subflava]|uniref:Lipoprotein n=1 Tax=Georgenia subflava TaxID=1622177 RepID=A0A6N7EMR8_9MICO|nr:hypothetical protein [Georgenia subflava]MPV38731.1 hypothetical protein [Georgenia subflava]
MRRTAVTAVLGALVVPGLAACSPPEPALPAAIACTTQYRPDHASDAGQRQDRLTVLRAVGVPAAPEALELPDFHLEVTYTGEAPEGRTVRLVVTTEDGDPLVSTLYQLDAPEDLAEHFGTQGFTGLHYVRNGPAELQIFCGPADGEEEEPS